LLNRESRRTKWLKPYNKTSWYLGSHYQVGGGGSTATITLQVPGKTLPEKAVATFLERTGFHPPSMMTFLYAASKRSLFHKNARDNTPYRLSIA